MRALLIVLLLTATATARPGGAQAPFVPPTRSTGAGGGGDITGVTAGTGLTGGATSGNATLAADTTYLQRLVSGVCAPGSSIRVINSDGTVSCEPDDVGTGTVTNVSTLAPLQGGPITTTGTVSLINCSPNLIYKENAGGTAFACAADNDTTYTASTGITLGGTNFTLSTIATARLFGNVSGSTAAPSAITGTQATTLLDTFTATLKGLVPSPGTATGTKYLSDSGTWTTPPGTGVTSSTLTTNQTVKASGAGSISNGWAVDDGTTWGVASKYTITEATGAVHNFSTLTVDGNTTSGATNANTHIMNGRLTLNADVSGYAAIAVGSTADVIVDIANQTPTTGKQFLLDSQSNGSFHILDGTSGDRFSIDTSGNVGIVAGSLDMGTHQIHNVTDPSSAQDASTKNYSDTHIGASGALTSGTVPVANGAASLANSAITDDGTSVKINTTKVVITEANGNTTFAGTINSGSVQSTGFLQGNTGVYAGASSQAYVTKAVGHEGFGCFYATNATATCKINSVGFSEGTTQFRDLDIQDGENGSIAYYTGSTKGVEFHGAVTADTTLGVTGNATLSADTTLGGVGHVLHVGAAHVEAKDVSNQPTISSCGTSPSVVGTDHSGIITVGTGGSSSCTITWKTAYGSNYNCMFVSRATGPMYLSTAVAYSTTNVVLTKALNASEKIDYFCEDH